MVMISTALTELNLNHLNLNQSQTIQLQKGGTSCFGAQCSITSKGLSGREDNPSVYEYDGLNVNPEFIMCAADVLHQVERVGDARPDLIKKMDIQEINIIIKLVTKVKATDYIVHRGDVAQIPNDPALNIQVPLLITEKTSTCKLTSDQALLNAMSLIASKNKD
ncbi:MAG: hypothetical protein KA715_03090 [Xanthomonadaceae bacterium]|nr:hypothetical protein [Xanthomonadaceae bacterium]